MDSQTDLSLCMVQSQNVGICLAVVHIFYIIQIVQTQSRPLLEEQSDLGLTYLLISLHHLEV